MTVSFPTLARIPTTELVTSFACMIQPSAKIALLIMVPLTFAGGNILALVYTFCALSNKLNKGTSCVKAILASKKE